MTTSQPPHPASTGLELYNPTPAGSVELAGERAQMVWVPGPGNHFVAVPRDALPADYFQAAPVAAQPRDLSPQPLLDPVAQRIFAGLLGGGGFAAGAGWGVAQVASALAGVSSGVLLAAAALVAAMRLPVPGGPAPARRGGDTYVTHNHQTVVGRGFLGRAAAEITSGNGGRR